MLCLKFLCPFMINFIDALCCLYRHNEATHSANVRWGNRVHMRVININEETKIDKQTTTKRERIGEENWVIEAAAKIMPTKSESKKRNNSSNNNWNRGHFKNCIKCEADVQQHLVRASTILFLQTVLFGIFSGSEWIKLSIEFLIELIVPLGTEKSFRIETKL